jgi:hypothetical protein
MNSFISIITTNALNRFETYDDTFKRVIPTAHIELTNMGYGIHKSFFGNDTDHFAPLSQRTGTYRLVCDPKDHEAIVEAIAEEFAKVSACVKLFAIEISRPTSTKWVARKEKAMTSQGKTTLTITWSEDSRITTENL